MRLPSAAATSLSLLLLSFAACDSRPPVGAADAAASADVGTSADSRAPDSTPITPPTIPPTVPPSSGACAVGIRVDNCCQAATPVDLAAVQSDQCLVLWEDRYDIPEVCRKRWPKRCALIDCAAVAPPSRVAERVGGKCQFADECRTNNDCTIATNTKTCCGCPAVVPRALLKTNACLHEHGTTPGGPLPKSCLRDCPDVLCAPCGVPVSVSCVLGDAFNRCSAQ